MKKIILNKEKRMKSKFIVIPTVIAVGLTFVVICPDGGVGCFAAGPGGSHSGF